MYQSHPGPRKGAAVPTPSWRAEHAAYRHLRNHSNYLTPGKTGRALRIPALVLQGMLRNFFAILPIILLLVVTVVVFWGPSIKHHLTDAKGGFEPIHHILILIAGPILLLWLLAVSPAMEYKRIERDRQRNGEGKRTRPRETRDGLIRTSSLLLLVFLICAFITLQPYMIVIFTQARYGLPTLTFLSGLGVAAFAAALARRTASCVVEHFTDRLLLLGLAVLGPITLWFVFLLLRSWAISPPLFSALYFFPDPANTLNCSRALRIGTY